MSENSRNSILCPKCGKLVSRDEKFCPWCKTEKPGSFLKSNPFSRWVTKGDHVVTLIIYVNVAMFAFSILINPGGASFSLNPFSTLAPDYRSLILLGATGTFPVEQYNRWWTLISAGWLHGGLLHILFNMMAVKQLAPFIIREYGKSRMFIIYTLTGICGFWASYIGGVKLTIGASASICGLIGAALYFGRSWGGIYGQAVYKQVSGWIVSLIVIGFVLPGINNWAHAGGVVSGVIVSWMIGYDKKRAETLVHRISGAACVAVTVFVLAGAVFSGFYLRFF